MEQVSQLIQNEMIKAKKEIVNEVLIELRKSSNDSPRAPRVSGMTS